LKTRKASIKTKQRIESEIAKRGNDSVEKKEEVSKYGKKVETGWNTWTFTKNDKKIYVQKATYGGEKPQWRVQSSPSKVSISAGESAQSPEEAIENHLMDKDKRTKKDKETSYDDLPYLPSMMAEQIANHEYTGSELGKNHVNSDSVKEIEAKRKNMTEEDKRKFGEYCDMKCEEAYKAKADWFMKIVKMKDGRGQLNVYLSHWLASWLNKKKA
jgi:hypothetical protein